MFQKTSRAVRHFDKGKQFAQTLQFLAPPPHLYQAHFVIWRRRLRARSEAKHCCLGERPGLEGRQSSSHGRHPSRTNTHRVVRLRTKASRRIGSPLAADVIPGFARGGREARGGLPRGTRWLRAVSERKRRVVGRCRNRRLRRLCRTCRGVWDGRVPQAMDPLQQDLRPCKRFLSPLQAGGFSRHRGVFA